MLHRPCFWYIHTQTFSLIHTQAPLCTWPPAPSSLHMTSRSRPILKMYSSSGKFHSLSLLSSAFVFAHYDVHAKVAWSSRLVLGSTRIMTAACQYWPCRLTELGVFHNLLPFHLFEEKFFCLSSPVLIFWNINIMNAEAVVQKAAFVKAWKDDRYQLWHVTERGIQSFSLFHYELWTLHNIRKMVEKLSKNLLTHSFLPRQKDSPIFPIVRDLNVYLIGKIEMDEKTKWGDNTARRM